MESPNIFSCSRKKKISHVCLMAMKAFYSVLNSSTFVKVKLELSFNKTFILF